MNKKTNRINIPRCCIHRTWTSITLGRYVEEEALSLVTAASQLCTNFANERVKGRE